MPSGSPGRPAETLLPIVWRGAMSFADVNHAGRKHGRDLIAKVDLCLICYCHRSRVLEKLVGEKFGIRFRLHVQPMDTEVYRKGRGGERGERGGKGGERGTWAGRFIRNATRTNRPVVVFGLEYL